jgi:hypothetical protein
LRGIDSASFRGGLLDRFSERIQTRDAGAAIDMAPATSPAIAAIKISFCVAAAAATPTIKLAVETMPSVAPSTRGSQPPDVVAGEDGSPDIPPVRSDPPEQNKNDNDDQDGAKDTDATVTEAVTVAAESATEATEQENDEDDNEDSSERHDFCPFAGPN